MHAVRNHIIELLAVLCALAAVLPASAQTPGSEGGPFWELSATSVSPRVTGTSIRRVDERTISLGDSTPAGWTVELHAESPFQPYSFYASDNRTGAIDVIVRRPGDTCTTATQGVRAVLQTATLDGPAPQGFGTMSGPCFGAAAPGIGLNITFTVQPPR